MKTLICIKPGSFEYRDIIKPSEVPNQSIIRVRRIGVCGTDLHAFQGTQPFFEYPRTLGHELSGDLVSVNNASGFEEGEAVTFIPYFSCGICIACRDGRPNCCSQLKVFGVHQEGGMVEYLSVPSNLLVHGKGLSYDELALVEPLSIGAHGVRRANIKQGENVVIIGVGPIGLASALFARLKGANVIILDIDKFRLSHCERVFGFQHTINVTEIDVINKLNCLTDGDMPSVVIDASGNLPAINEGFKYLAHGGRYILVGLQKNNIIFSHPEFHKREATLMSSRNATRQDFEYVIDKIKGKHINIEGFISTYVGFHEIKSEFTKWLPPNSGIIKAMIKID